MQTLLMLAWTHSMENVRSIARRDYHPRTRMNVLRAWSQLALSLNWHSLDDEDLPAWPTRKTILLSRC